MPPRLSLNELYNMHHKKENSKKAVFDKILELCHRRIRNISSFGGMNVFYEIPGLLIGYPLFNIEHCRDYVISQLRKSGLIVQILPPPQVNVLYISWDPEEIKATKKSQIALPAPSRQALPPPTKVLPPKKELSWNFE